MQYHIVNGLICETKDPSIHISDLGLLRGYGIFDFFPIYGGQAVFQEEYFDRFYSSARRIKLEVPLEKNELAKLIATLTKKNGEGNGFVRLVLTGGNSTNGFTPAAPNLIIAQYPEVHYDHSLYVDGVRLLLQKFNRFAPTIKSLNYANAISLRDLLAEQNSVDLLYHDGRLVYETSRANFFIVDKNGVLCTSHDTVLRGITRSKVLQLARDQYEVNIAPLSLAQVARASEAFITSTTKGVMPVTSIDNMQIGDGKVGPKSQQLQGDFHSLSEAYTAQIPSLT